MALAAAPSPASAPVAKAASMPITAETRPELFRDVPPDRPAPDAAGHAPESTTSFWLSMLVRTTLVLAAVVALAYLILGKGLGRLVKGQQSGRGRIVSLVERLPLDQKHALYLIEAEGRRFVVGTADGATQLVLDLSRAAKESDS
jgi:flagellar biogenesis protein FliO